MNPRTTLAASLIVLAATGVAAASCGAGDTTAGETGTSGIGSSGAGAATGSGSSTSSTGGATTSSSGATTSSSGATTSSSGEGSSGAPTGVGPDGGTLDTLSFAIVGDTRPAIPDDTAGYPDAIIQKIWQDIAAHAPPPAFAVMTGDYMFATQIFNQAGPQLDKYLAARAAFPGFAFPAMGNHECTGATASNCGQGNADGITEQYTAFMQKLLAPLGKTEPYYSIAVKSPSDAWTAKFVFIAPNAWDAGQAAWFSAELAKPTTYTFVVRHEATAANKAPGVDPSTQILAGFPHTLSLSGHTHTLKYNQAEKEIIVGIGGAPLSGSANYGYVVAKQRPDGAIQLDGYDYMTNASVLTFAVKADGTPAP